ncbi:hypothetical protein SAY86_015656 [Trapa natans]|uniref:RING-type domain-containing protein n=1 Tax=Trapa natans TaxID=22666 RepID=A0AAN7LBK8_TRANT|nr:hypothetical protein SAY86_015656 [Trapa natans]
MAYLQQQFDPQTQLHLQEPEHLRTLRPMDVRVSHPVAYYHPNSLQDRPQHPPYIAPFNAVGLAPVPAPLADDTDGGLDLKFNFSLEPKRKMLKEQDFFDSTSQMSSLDLFQARSVSTGLGLSFDNNKIVSSGDSALLSLISDDVDCDFHKLDADIDRFLKIEADRLRQNIMEKIKASQLQSLSILESRILQKLHEKEVELKTVNSKNLELEQHVQQLAVEAGAWQQEAQRIENMIVALNYELQKIQAQSKDSKEGCGESEVDDTATCCNGRATDLHLLSRENGDKKEVMVCKFCSFNRVCMLLLPCRHLCVCKECESRLIFCPLCQSMKSMSLEVVM